MHPRAFPGESRVALEGLKFACLAEGLTVSAAALHVLGGVAGISVHEYPTTAGLTFEVGGVLVNAPFDPPGRGASTVRFEWEGGNFAVWHGERRFEVDRVLPLPGYLTAVLSNGDRVADLVMTHVDRARLSPIKGCAYDCAFCPLADLSYQRRRVEHLLEALEVARADDALPVRHVLISGGSPGRAHVGWFNDLCARIIRECDIPVDVMFSPQHLGVETVDALVDAGVHGLSINLELYDHSASKLHLPSKHRMSRPFFEATVTRAVERLGSVGRVRSLVIAGLESEEQTLAGVEYIASLGAHPVLSPFQTAPDIRLRDHPTLSAQDLHRIVDASRSIVAQYGVALGPSCVSCQHNTATLPWDGEACGVAE